MDRDSVAHGPANDVFKWAGYRATVNEQNRTKTTTYYLIDRELRLCENEAASSDSTIKSQKALIEDQRDRITFLSERVRRLESAKPRRGIWFGVGVLAGFILKQETQD